MERAIDNTTSYPCNKAIVAIFRADLTKSYYVVYIDLTIEKRQRLDVEMRMFLAAKAAFTKVWRNYTICTTNVKTFMLIRDYILTIKEFCYEQAQQSIEIQNTQQL